MDDVQNNVEMPPIYSIGRGNKVKILIQSHKNSRSINGNPISGINAGATYWRGSLGVVKIKLYLNTKMINNSVQIIGKLNTW